jgi:hypothetical protein
VLRSGTHNILEVHHVLVLLTIQSFGLRLHLGRLPGSLFGSLLENTAACPPRSSATESTANSEKENPKARRKHGFACSVTGALITTDIFAYVLITLNSISRFHSYQIHPHHYITIKRGSMTTICYNHTTKKGC